MAFTTLGVVLLLVLVLSTQTVKSGSLPVFQQRVVPRSAVPGSEAGFSTAITPSGLRAVVGTPASYSGLNGSVSIYDRIGSTWKETATLSESNDPSSSSFGYSVAIAQDGLTVVVGCPYCADDVGSFYVFERNGNSWNGPISLAEEDPAANSELGLGVAISQDGKTLACTTRHSDGGAVVFAKQNGLWTQQGSRLTVPDVVGNSFNSVALSGNGNSILFGTYISTSAVLAFYKRNSSSMWYQSGPLILNSNDTYGIGYTVAMTADGVFAVSGGLASGSAFVFKLSADETTYQVLQQLIAPGSDSAYAYRQIAISSLGEYIVIGDTQLYGDISYTKGGAFIFKLLSDRASFGLVGNITMPFFNATLSDKSAFGISVAVSDHGNFLVGASGEDAYTGNCRPAYSTSLALCNKQNKACGGSLKWVKKGCKVPGSKIRLGDGGCQCKGYCGYGCRSACNRDHQCVWATKSNTCLVKATGQPGVPILSC